MLIPLYGFLEGDTVGLLVLARPEDTLRKLAANLLQAAAMRVEPYEYPQIYWAGRLLDPDKTVGDAGLTALERIDVRRKETPWPMSE